MEEEEEEDDEESSVCLYSESTEQLEEEGMRFKGRKG